MLYQKEEDGRARIRVEEDGWLGIKENKLNLQVTEDKTELFSKTPCEDNASF